MFLKNSQNSYDNKEFRFDSWDVRVYDKLNSIDFWLSLIRNLQLRPYSQDYFALKTFVCLNEKFFFNLLPNKLGLFYLSG